MSRASRRPQVQTPLSPLESLLLAQATWELGAGPNAWQGVAKLLSKQPLLSRPKSFFNAQSCHAMYEQLMKDAEFELSESNDGPHAPMNLKLAEKHFRSRHTELRELILAEESKFKTILKEIEDIRAGLWDKKIESQVTGKVLLDEDKGEDDTEILNIIEKTGATPSQSTDEIFDGSELSGVTESVESASSFSLPKDDLVVSSTNEEHDLSQTTIAPPADIPERSLTPRGNTKSLSPPLPADVIEQLVAETSQDDEMPPAAETAQSPPTSGSHMAVNDANVAIPINEDEDVDMESPSGKNEEQKEEKTLQTEISPEVGEPESVDQHTGYIQEEEEDEEGPDKVEDITDEISGKEQEDLVDTESEGDVALRPQPSEQEEQEDSERAQTPAIVIPVSDGDAAANDGHSSGSEEEPREPARRSTRRRKASVTLAPPISTRKRLRSQARLSESELQTTVDSENEDEREQEMRDEDTPQPEEVSSPFDGVMTRRREGKRKASFLDNVDSLLEKKRMREDSEPVDEDEPGPSSHNTRGRITRQGMRTEEQVALKRFQNVIGMLHSQISQHRNGTIFHNPIKNSEAPDYHEIVKRPMDLKTIKTRVKDGLIANSLEFQRDIFLMFANSMMYNRPGSDVFSMAEDMMVESEAQIIAFRQTEGMVKRGQRP